MSILLRMLKQVIAPPSRTESIAPVTDSHKSTPGQVSVEFNGCLLQYTTPNNMAAWRAQSFFTKEPDTVAWLSKIPRGSIFLDVGANVGLYTIAAAMARGCKVFAFEPESQNYALLNQNIALNHAHNQVTAYCAALSDTSGPSTLFLSNFDPWGGGSCHSFGAEVGFDLMPRRSPFLQGCLGLTIDELVSTGVMPVPNYVKIDVDGFEHKVISGGRTTLQNPLVKEILIEINPSLEEHKQLISELANLGFYFDADQHRRAQRKSGTFEGVGEIIFKRADRTSLKVTFDTKPSFIAGKNVNDEVLDHILSRIHQTQIDNHPYPHIVVDNFFPESYFQQALSHFPSDEQMTPLSETGRTDGYKERLVTLFNDAHFSKLDNNRRQFWQGFSDWLYSDRFINSVVDKFWPHVACRLNDLNAQGTGVQVHGDALIVSDKSNYAIGPHTDAPHRLITFLFYMPEDEQWSDLGTSIYTPKEPGFSCSGSAHHSFELFDTVDTIAFKPNRALIFVRNNHSFHGVERITRENPIRHLVINNIRIVNHK